MKNCLLLSAVLLSLGQSNANAEISNGKYYGELIEMKHTITDSRIGACDRDIKSTSIFTAPSGYRILDQKIVRKGHHSSTYHVKTTQAGEISYRSEVMAELFNYVRQGFASGQFHLGNEKGSANTAMNLAKFLKRFKAKYSFHANTNSQVAYKWNVVSKCLKYGAKNKSHAVIKLEKVPTEKDAQIAVEVIKFALEQKIRVNLFALIDTIMPSKFQEGSGIEAAKINSAVDQKRAKTSPKEVEKVVKQKPKEKSNS